MGRNDTKLQYQIRLIILIFLIERMRLWSYSQVEHFLHIRPPPPNGTLQVFWGHRVSNPSIYRSSRRCWSLNKLYDFVGKDHEPFSLPGNNLLKK